MSRFLSTSGMFVLIGALTVLQAQTMRPAMPGQGPNQPANTAPRMPQPPTPAALGTPTPAAGSSPAIQPSQPVAQPSPIGPPVAPVVTFRDELLTVQAVNPNLSRAITDTRNKN